MKRVLMEKFEQEDSVNVDNPVALLNLVKSCSQENLDLTLQDLSTLTVIKKYEEFQDKVSTGLLGKYHHLLVWLRARPPHPNLFCEKQHQTLPNAKGRCLPVLLI